MSVSLSVCVCVCVYVRMHVDDWLHIESAPPLPSPPPANFSGAMETWRLSCVRCVRIACCVFHSLTAALFCALLNELMLFLLLLLVLLLSVICLVCVCVCVVTVCVKFCPSSTRTDAVDHGMDWTRSMNPRACLGVGVHNAHVGRVMRLVKERERTFRWHM